MEVRDPVHGFIEVDDHERDIIDHPVFQRLRGIRQLAMAHLAFPGATHTRFEHSLGVLHIAERMARRTELSDEDRRHVRLAALLHDIGHGPFSHVSEYVLEGANPGSAAQGATEEAHEAVSVQIIDQVFHAERLINRTERDAVVSILTGLPPAVEQAADKKPVKRRTVMSDIVSGPLDADKLDYLLRDSYYTGVRLGVYDIERLFQVMSRLDDDDEVQSYIAIDESDVSAVDQLIFARHNMTQQVYRHKIRRITDAMLMRAVLAAIDEGNDKVLSVYRCEKRTCSDLSAYTTCDDRHLTDLVLGGPAGWGKELMERLCRRRLLKQVFRENIENCRPKEDFPEETRRRVNSAEELLDLEGHVADALGLDEHLVFVELLQVKPPRPLLSEPYIEPESIQVKSARGEPKSYDEVSQVFRHGELKGYDLLCVYAPVDEADAYRKKARYVEMREAIATVFGVQTDGDGAHNRNSAEDTGDEGDDHA